MNIKRYIFSKVRKKYFLTCQKKVLERIFREGPEGFTGRLSAENYVAIAKTSRATATCDLAELVNLGALTKTGKLKGIRYWL